MAERNIAGAQNKWIWKAKVPLKLKVFLWQLCQDVVLTRENMKKRNWPGAPRCSFCNLLESNNHLFFTCKIVRVVWGILGKALGTDCVPQSFWQAVTWFHVFMPKREKFHIVILATVCWAIWNTRNKVTFDKFVLKSLSVISFFSVSLLMYCVGLQKDARDKGKLMEGAQN
jgi:hypothetical protein